jgi:uncharacterized protein with HEPN domain
MQAYFSVNWVVVWETITRDLQDLDMATQQMLEREFPDASPS